MIRNFLYKKCCLFLCDLLVDNDEKQNSEFRNNLYRSLGFNIGKTVYISKKVDFICPENIYLKDYCCIGQYNQIQAFNTIEIGKYCHFATNVTMIAGSHNNDDFAPKSNQEIIIGPGCWFGAGVTVLGGVKIGKGCIIGAGSVVNKDIPDFSIVAGVPARIIKKREPSERIWHPAGYYNLSDLENTNCEYKSEANSFLQYIF